MILCATSCELFGRYWNRHQAEDANCMPTTSTWTPDRLQPAGWGGWLPMTSPPANQKNVHELTTPCSLTPHYPPPSRAGHTSLEVIGLLQPPLPGKAIKLFLLYFIQNCLCISIRHLWTGAEFLEFRQHYRKKQTMKNKTNRIQGNIWRWWICLWPWLQWWFHACMYMPKFIKSYALNMCSFKYINCTSIKLK